MEPDTEGRAAGPSGSRFVGVGIGLAAFALFVMLPFLIPITFYVVANVYAATKGTTFSSGTASARAVVLFPVGLAVAIAYLGRVLSPKRRRA